MAEHCQRVLAGKILHDRLDQAVLRNQPHMEGLQKPVWPDSGHGLVLLSVTASGRYEIPPLPAFPAADFESPGKGKGSGKFLVRLPVLKPFHIPVEQRKLADQPCDIVDASVPSGRLVFQLLVPGTDMGKQRGHHLHSGLEEHFFIQILTMVDRPQRSGLIRIRQSGRLSRERHLSENPLVERPGRLQRVRAVSQHDRFQNDHGTVIFDLFLIKLPEQFCQRIVVQRIIRISRALKTGAHSLFHTPEAVPQKISFSIVRFIFIVLMLCDQAVQLLRSLHGFRFRHRHAEPEQFLRRRRFRLRHRDQKLLRRLRIIEPVSLFLLRFFTRSSLELLNQDLLLIGGLFHQLRHGPDALIQAGALWFPGEPQQHVQSGAPLLLLFIRQKPSQAFRHPFLRLLHQKPDQDSPQALSLKSEHVLQKPVFLLFQTELLDNFNCHLRSARMGISHISDDLPALLPAGGLIEQQIQKVYPQILVLDLSQPSRHGRDLFLILQKPCQIRHLDQQLRRMQLRVIPWKNKRVKADSFLRQPVAHRLKGCIERLRFLPVPVISRKLRRLRRTQLYGIQGLFLERLLDPVPDTERKAGHKGGHQLQILRMLQQDLSGSLQLQVFIVQASIVVRSGQLLVLRSMIHQLSHGPDRVPGFPKAQRPESGIDRHRIVGGKLVFAERVVPEALSHEP